MQLNKANKSDTDASFLDLHLTIFDNKITTKIYDKRDDYSFNIVNYPNLDGDVPKATSYGVYMSQLNRFAKACTNVEDFHARNLNITKRLLRQGYRFHRLRKTFSKFFHRSRPLLAKYDINLKTYLNLGVSQPKFYGDVLYKIKKILNSIHFYNIFQNIFNKFIKKGYRKDILLGTARKVLKPSVLSRVTSFN